MESCIPRWFVEGGLEAFQVVPEDVSRAYFLAASCIFEPDRATERLAWAKMSVLANTISANFRSNLSGKKMMVQFLHSGLCEENESISW